MKQDASSLVLCSISKRFGANQALHPLDLQVEEGELLALLGPSGCGKTTTLRIVAGFESSDTGSVRIGERDITALPPNQRGLGMMSQSYSLFPHMTVAENIGFGLRMRKVPAGEATKRLIEALQLVRLQGFEDRYIHQLSGGQQQRVALARAIVTQPSVLLLDEPMGALDKHLRERMQFELRSLQQRLGITSVMVTHDQEEALTMSDRIAVMHEGRIVQAGTPAEVYARPRTRFVAEFLGTANIFDATVDEAGANGQGRVRLDIAPERVLPVGGLKQARVGQRVRVAVRPERFTFASGEAAAFGAQISAVIFRGNHYAYELRAPGRGAPVFITSQDRVAAAPGQSVGLTWPAEDAVVLVDEDPPR
ncbi:MAG TPA: ABC transporter ATP-binding protein [Bordetella sp.]